MSVWGPGIFESDIAADIRDVYRELLLDGMDDDQAASRVLEDFADALADPDDGGSFVIALAVTMHKVGRARDDITARAIAAIDAGPEAWWAETKAKRAREKVLTNARELLTGPQPPRRRLRRPWQEETSLRPGDVLALKTDPNYVLLRVANLRKSQFGASPVFATLDFHGSRLPPIEEIEQLPDATKNQIRYRETASRGPVFVPAGESIFRFRKKDPDYFDVGFELVGRISQRPGDVEMQSTGGCTWDGAAQFVAQPSWWEPRVAWSDAEPPESAAGTA